MADDVRLEDKRDVCTTSKIKKQQFAYIPSYLVVQNQLRDLVHAQRSVVDQLSSELSFHQHLTLQKETVISLADHESKVKEIEVQIAEDYIPKKNYSDIVERLEVEKSEHASTKAKLNQTLDKLECALGEIDVLKKQLEREKISFQMAFGTLQSKAKEVSSRKNELETKVLSISKVVQRQEADLGSCNDEIKVLQRKLNQQRQLHQRKLAEVEVEQQQQKYIALALTD